jgi:hypothetical protein
MAFVVGQGRRATRAKMNVIFTDDALNSLSPIRGYLAD